PPRGGRASSRRGRGRRPRGLGARPASYGRRRAPPAGGSRVLPWRRGRVLGDAAHEEARRRRGRPLALLDAPDGFLALLDPLPEGVHVGTDLRGAPDVVVAFTRRRVVLARQLPKLGRAIHPDGMAWIAWPKRASKVPTDVTEDVVREEALALGLV